MDTSSSSSCAGDQSQGSSGSSPKNNNQEKDDKSQEAEAVTANLSSHFEEFLKQHQLQQLQNQGFGGTLGLGSAQMMGNVEVDESPLKPSLNRNKESLKLKLQMRRPFNQLVEQGILPSPNTPPAFACQRVKLERARMSDLLKAKIQQRPSRQELVRQHILEETDSRVAPLLAEKQRMLKRARLADSLNDHLIHRPGPLELVQKNILHAPDESIEKAIKDGIVAFKATCEGAIPGPSLPTKYICQEDDSSSDVSSPSVNLDITPVEENSESLPPVATLLSDGDNLKSPESVQMQDAPPKPEILPQIALSSVPIPPPFPFATSLSEIKMSLQSPQPQQGVGIFAVPIFTNASPLPATSTITQSQQPLYHHSQSSIKSRTKKICKPKSQPKPKTIKFHEYKGPPSAQKSGGLGSLDLGLKRPGESSYELLLQQQQLFLQWQLEWQHRFPKILLPAVSKMPLSAEDKKSFCSSISSLPMVTSSPITAATVFPSTVSHHQSIQPQPCLTTAGPNESVPVQISLTPTFCRENSVLILSSAPSTSSENATKPVVNTQIAPVGFQNSVVQATGPQTFIITNPGTPVPVKVSETNATEVDGQSIEPSINKSSIPLKLNDWKVNELKTELKKRNLPVSGSKSQLLERLQLSYIKNPELKTSGNLSDRVLGSKESSTSSSPPQLDKTSEDVSESRKVGTVEVVPQNSTVQTTAQELKFYVTNTGNGATTISLPNALEFLQKSGVLSTEKDSQGGPTQVFIQPNSRSVLQQKIQQKLLQQAIKTQNQLKENNQSTNQVKNALTAPLVTSVGIINQQQLRTWKPSATVINTSIVTGKEIVEPTKDPGIATGKTEATNPPSENAWVLKITESNEVGPTEFQKSFENCLADLLSDTAEPPPSAGRGIEVNLDADADHIKSQMVDDVLEILIRNGELPASAAQHLPGDDKEGVVSENVKSGFIPPAPPLPPSTFAITLPTEITFRRTNAVGGNMANTNHDSDHLEQFDSQGRPIQERKGSLGMTLLTKEAQEILKISEELATFGKSHSESNITTESQNHPQSHLLTQSVPCTSGIKTERIECDSKAGLNGNVADSMDLCMEDSHSISLHSDAGLHGTYLIQPGHILRSDETSMDTSTTREQFPGIITFNKPSNGEQSITELLTEDLEFPMDMEYSDWLESFSSDNAFTNNFAGNRTDESNKPGGIGSTFGNNKSSRVGVDDRPQGSTQDSQFGTPASTHDPFSHRDPLLSSKSSTRMLLTANNHNILDNCSNLVDSSGNVLMDIDTETDLRRKDGHTPSALDVNVNDLWDFSF